MLAPRASNAFVCLRCELKLARPRNLALSAQPSNASFSTSARRHDGADEAHTVTASDAAVPEREGAKSLRISREYIQKGKVVRQRKAKLGMKRMDEEADVLVLNEAPVRRETETQEPEILEPISVPDILSSLQQDSAPATQEDVEKQLASLRPTRGNPDEPQYVATADFVKLVAALTRGFTTSQLSGYYSTAKSLKKGTVYKVVKATVQATKRSQWHPTTTNIEKRLPGVEPIGGKKQKPKSIRKATLVDKILRDVWKLELLEEMEAPGELELRMKEWELKLLQNGGNDSALARIAKVRNAKAEIHWPTNVLRITADKNTAEYTADDIEATLSKAHTTVFHPQRWIEQLDKDRASNLAASLPVNYVSSLTGAHIVATNNDNVAIHALDKASAIEARRTLIRLMPLKGAKRTIDTQRLDAAQNGIYLSPVFLEPDSLDFAQRDLQLGRWVLPVTRSTDAASPDDQLLEESTALPSAKTEQTSHSIVNRVVSLLKPPVDDIFLSSGEIPRKRQTGYWSLEPEYKVSADFGQVLFSLQLQNKNKVVEAISDPTVSPFQPSIPGLSNLLASTDFDQMSRTETPALLYDFLPGPDQRHLQAAPGPDFPRLFIQVRTGRERSRPTIHKLSLGFQKRIHDVLLPDQATDIRFHRYGRLRFSIKSHHDKNVQNWLEAVQENIESGGRLTAPSLTIDIPKWTIPGSPPDATGQVSIKYHFSGIQFRQTVTGRMLNTQVSYSTIQSGKIGAKCGALSAYPDRLSSNDYEAQIRDFASKCVDMVDYISQAGAQTHPPRQTVLPRNHHSARKQRRAALQNEMQSRILDQSQDQEIDEENDIDYPDFESGLESDAQTDASPSPNDPQTDAYLASRLDDAIPPVDADFALDAALNEAAENQRDYKSKLQQQQADALLEDLFGADGAEEKAEAVGTVDEVKEDQAKDDDLKGDEKI